MFRQDFTCPALLKDLSPCFTYGAVTRYGRTFQTVPLHKQKTTGLLRFRSPLLAESRLMSFPPGTEMFQFPGFASTAYVFSGRYPKGVGCPIRTSTDQRLLAAPRGFSQRATSFIASWCQGIHRMPFLRSRSCFSRALADPEETHHAQEPSTPNARASHANHPATAGHASQLSTQQGPPVPTHRTQTLRARTEPSGPERP
jgi:hypothetical protein